MGSKNRSGGRKHHREAEQLAVKFAEEHNLDLEIGYYGNGHLMIRLSDGRNKATIAVACSPRTDNTDDWLKQNMRRALRRLESKSSLKATA